MTEEIKILLITTIIAALIIGFIIGRLIPNKKQTQASQQELDDYKQSVSNHFAETANLVDNLTDSYKAVFDHLGDSAKNLLNKEEIDKLLESRQHKITTLNYLSKEDTSKEDMDKINDQDSAFEKNETIDIDNPEAHKKSSSFN